MARVVIARRRSDTHACVFVARHSPTQLYEQYGYTEFIELKFATPVYPTAIRVGENRGMCSVVRIQGRDSTGESAFVDLWRAADRFTADGLLDTAAKRAECWAKYDNAKRCELEWMFKPGRHVCWKLRPTLSSSFVLCLTDRTFLPNICQQPVLTDVLRLELDTRSVSDWNELDYVQLEGSTVLPNGVLPANTSGLWYVPKPGFVGRDSLQIVTYDCPFDEERRGQPVDVFILVEGNFPPPSPPPQIMVPR
eukprot:362778-Prymnesium_polylepis.1